MQIFLFMTKNRSTLITACVTLCMKGLNIEDIFIQKLLFLKDDNIIFSNYFVFSSQCFTWE